MKKIKVTILNHKREPLAEIEANDHYPFAVHVAYADREDSRSHARRWAVTHVPSGHCTGQNYTFAQATAIAKHLARDRFWLTTDPTKWTKKIAAEAKAKFELALAETAPKAKE